MSYNSTIKPKKEWLDCGCYSCNFSKRRCRFHATIQDSIKRIKKHDELLVSSSLLKLVDNKSSELNRWFAEIKKQHCSYGYHVVSINTSGGNCWECGAHIPEKFFKAAIAHILPKRKEYGCPSVATNEYNYLILGAGCGCHNRYDRSWNDASKMKVWPLAKERFRKFCDEIHPSERKNIPEEITK